MVLLILGILIFLFSLFLKPIPGIEQPRRIGRIVGIGLVLAGIIVSSFVQIDAGNIGVKKLFGRVQPEVLVSGLHFVNPLFEIDEMDVRTQNYTMSGINDEGHKSGDDAIRVLTADGLEVTIDLTVLYRLTPAEAPRLVSETGTDYEDKIVRPIARTRIRDNAVYYEAVALYSTKRDEFQSRIFKAIEADFRKRGLFLESLLVRNITLPASVKGAIEQKIQAEQEAQKMQFVLQKERQEADRKRVEAQGIADYQQIISASLTDKQLQYEQIKANMELARSQNAKMIIMNGRGAPVILNADK
ncbi:SPFH domain, Band 7 family protein [Cnuella takakiae]|uniref:SPFH domain, Band 7 family protein n=1 Tax=Cnuella takakiae TaxID=1302690 RepID=A0A1M5H3S3_9BACT|nr:prohibitin family protein [Cnuella takakiae]OLY91127.1 band 7 protein [Cnuella takakiae]SHG10594.1 SPFH domain, Band 7 family protein [Cnuella takakiae]